MLSSLIYFQKTKTKLRHVLHLPCVCIALKSFICNLFGKFLLNSLDKNAFECQNIVSVSNRLLVLMSSLIPSDRYFCVNLMEVIYSSRKITMQFRILNCHKYYHSKWPRLRRFNRFNDTLVQVLGNTSMNYSWRYKK